MVWQKLFGERATTKVVAVFDTQAQAEACVDLLQSEGLQATQLQQVAPNEKGYDIKLEPEPKGIARTAVRAHTLLGAAGLVLGLLIWLALYYGGVGLITSTPLPSAIALLFFMTAGGMMLGGLVTARPDHQLVIERTRTATSQGKWSLVIHPRNPQQCDAVVDLLAATDVEATRSV